MIIHLYLAFDLQGLWKAPLSFRFISPVWDGQVNTELTHKPSCYTLLYLPGTTDVCHCVNLSLPVTFRIAEKKIVYYKKTNLSSPIFLNQK